MATTNDLKNGVALSLEDQLWQIIEFQHVKSGKDPTFVRTKIKNVLSGKTVGKTFNADLRVEAVTVDRRDMQYLYKSSDDYVFIDVRSCEQTYVPSTATDETATFMLENQEVIVAFHKDSVLFVELPASIVLTISHTEPDLQGNRSSVGAKPTTVETGAEIQVPLLLNTGDKVRMGTRSDFYIPRVSD